MTLDPNAPEIITLSNNDILEVFSGNELKRITGQNLANSINTNIGNVVLPFVTVKQFGAVGNGVADDTSAIQTAINYAISNGVELWFNKGVYKISAPLVINPNKNTFIMKGQFFDTQIVTSSTLDSMLDINRMAYGEISGFRLSNISGSNIVDKMINYYWDGVGGTRSVTQNIFKDIYIDGRFRVGMKIGKDGTGVQCDNTLYERVIINGAFHNNQSSTTIYQVGVECGDNVFANNLLHNFVNLTIVGCKTGFYCNNAGYVTLSQASFSLNEMDFNIESVTSFSMNNFRSENAGSFLKAVTGGATFGNKITITNSGFTSPQSALSLWASGTSNPNNYIMQLSQGGTYIVDNFNIEGLPTGVVPIIRLTGAQRKQCLNIRGYTISTSTNISNAASLFQYDTKSSIDARHIARASTAGELNDTETYYSFEVINGVIQ